MRNQNIYTARVTDGLFVSAPGNNKQFNGFQRAFVVVAENATAAPRTYRLRIENQPVGGQASFLQFGAPLTTLDVSTPALSSVARTVFVTAQDQNARIRVSVTEINGVGGAVVTNGLTGTVVLNPDPQNPVLQNPVLQNPVLQNPSRFRRASPTIPASARRSSACRTCRIRICRIPICRTRTCRTRRFRTRTCRTRTCRTRRCRTRCCRTTRSPTRASSTPICRIRTCRTRSCRTRTCRTRISRTRTCRTRAFSDTNWVVTNEGNTTASYTVNLLLNTPVPAGFSTQLLLHKTFTTPAADGCELKEQPHTILLANIPNPQFVTDPTNPNLQNPNLQNPNLQNPDAGARARRVGDDHASASSTRTSSTASPTTRPPR